MYSNYSAEFIQLGTCWKFVTVELDLMFWVTAWVLRVHSSGLFQMVECLKVGRCVPCSVFIGYVGVVEYMFHYVPCSELNLLCASTHVLPIAKPERLLH